MTCIDHSESLVDDLYFGQWRCQRCGHRVAGDDGKPVRRTRSYPPGDWLRELHGRRLARRGLPNRLGAWWGRSD